MSRDAATKRWINPTIIGIGLASLFSDVGHEMATAALPAFVATLGISSAMLGLIEGVSDALASFAKLLSGRYSDRLRHRKPLAAIGYFVTAAGLASFAFATNGWHVLFGRSAGWLGRGARSPVRKVLLAEATTPETYGRAFGLERSMDSAGAIIGPLVAIALLPLLGLRKLFLVTLVPGLCAALLITFAVKEKPHEPAARTSAWSAASQLPRAFRRYLFAIGIAGLGDFSNTLLILWATQAWTARLGIVRAAELAMFFYVGYNAVYTLSCYVAGILGDRFPKNFVLAAGYALAVIPAGALLWPGDSYVKFAIVFGFSGLYMGFWETLESAAAAAVLPAQSRGLGFGVLDTINGVGDFISSAAVGALWVLSPAAAMCFVMAASLVGASLMAWISRD